MASSGVDLTVVVAGFAAIGWWLDRKYGWAPWGVLVGAILGIVGGLANFLRDARQATHASSASESPSEQGGSGPDAS